MNDDIKTLLQYSKELEVLYVEDDIELQKRVGKIFGRFFKKVDTAQNGQEGLDVYQDAIKNDKVYDLVLTDINMPIKNGLEMSENILKNSPQQRIIIISAHNEAEYLHRAIDLGISGFLTKPIDNTQLFRQLFPVCSAVSTKKSYDKYVQQIEEQNKILKEQTQNKKLEKLQEEFLRNISHEIKTPLNAIIGFSSALKDFIDKNDEKAMKYVKIVKESSRQIEVLSNKILQLSQLRSGTYEILKESYILKPLLEKIIESYTQKAKENDIIFNCKIDESLDAELECDLRVIKTVISELLDNAIKFNKKGGRIGLLVAYDDASQSLKIDIKDNGVSIDLPHREKIFEMFYQVDGSTERSHEGAGIGLTLAKHMLELNGGSIELEITEDKKTFFHVTLPIE